MKCVAVMGATATGKSSVAIALAREFDGEIVSMDSRQVYRGLDIGTGKVTPQERALVPHHLIDILDPEESGSAGRHAEAAREALARISTAGRLPFLVGGTGLYFRALFEGLADVSIPDPELRRLRGEMEGRTTPDLFRELAGRDPERAAQLSPNDRLRITRALEIIAHTGRPVSEIYAEGREQGEGLDPLKFVLTMPRAQLRERVAARTRELFAAGWVDEVRRLVDAGLSRDIPAMHSLGYGEIAEALERGDSLESLVEAVTTATQRYAKRQETFFRGEVGALWIDVTEAGFERRMAMAVAAHTGRIIT